ncbi:MAG: hypothetical protein H7Z38_05410 [Rubrivivax sp.]|nr:hypothetical protein [Pyrinomonadaceae bacterium]
MKSKTGSLQLTLISDARAEPRPANADLVGRIFSDGSSDIRVMCVSRANLSHVIVKRAADGKSWAVPAGLVRLITKGERRARAA